METLGAALVGFIIATVIVLTELITAQYPRTYSFLLRDKTLYVYGFIYGAIAFGVMLAFDGLVTAGAIKVEGLGLSSPWVRAVAVGIAIKAFLHINLFNVSVGSQAVPVGLQTIVLLFELGMLRALLVDEFSLVRAYIKPYAQRYPNLNDVKEKIMQNIPDALPSQDCDAFKNDLTKKQTVVDAMELFLRFLGRGIFERTFPPQLATAAPAGQPSG